MEDLRKSVNHKAKSTVFQTVRLPASVSRTCINIVNVPIKAADSLGIHWKLFGTTHELDRCL